MLKQRILTALLFGGIFIGIIVSGSGPLFVLFIALVVAVAAWEWAGLSGNQRGPERVFYAIAVIILFSICYLVLDPSWRAWIIIPGAIWWCVAGVMVVAHQRGKAVIPHSKSLKYLMGCCLLIPASLSLIVLYEVENGVYTVLMFFFLIWVVDSTAYFTGRRWGRRHLASRISPAKTWEGFIGSLLVTVLPAMVYIKLKGICGMEMFWLIVLFVITAGFSAVGDLFESMFKRHINLKDSGHLLPGHGGMLDRIDSLTAAAPVFVSGLWLLEGRL